MALAQAISTGRVLKGGVYMAPKATREVRSEHDLFLIMKGVFAFTGLRKED